jgi:hypothetical protein
MRLLFAICVLASVCSHSIGGEVPKEMHKNVKVFWISSQVETYIPVTAENIEKMAFKIVDVKNEKQAAEITGAIQKSDQTVDPKRIRIKILTEDKFFNFDSNGIGVSSTGEGVRVDLKRLKLVLCE